MARYTSEDVHRALFEKLPEPRSLEELRDGLRQHVTAGAEDMLPEYDFRGGVRGKHARALAIPLPESHRAELERRLADLEENPDAGSPWEEVRARLERAR